MRLSLHSRARLSGFTLLELIIAISIIAILSGVVMMRSRGVVDSSRVSKVLQNIETLRMACAQFNSDTSQTATEYQGYSAAYRQLSGTQTMTNWKGPYLDSPFVAGQSNPWGTTAHLYNTVTANSWITGFDVDGDGTNEVTGTANMLYLDNVPPESAKSLNDSIDGSLAGVWSDSGKVRYIAASRIVLVLVYF
jgi:prepilin-type N-terminal cleavage/methylation domain-containing protein